MNVNDKMISDNKHFEMNNKNKSEVPNKQCKTKCDCKKAQPEYGYYSRLLEKPFDSIEELYAAEAAYKNAQRAKEAKAAQKKADATAVEDSFKALNAARKQYKESIDEATTTYRKQLEAMKSAFETRVNDIQTELATAEAAYKDALKAFADKYPEGYHITLKDGDFETTIHRDSKTTRNVTRTPDIFDFLFNWTF